MKKLLSLLLCICLLTSLQVSAQEVFIELQPLEHTEYMRGETLFISGDANVYTTLGLYPPDSNPIYIMTYSPEELREGFEIELGTDEKKYPYGAWTIILQYGEEAMESLEFELVEERIDSDEGNDGWRPPVGDDSSSNNSNTGSNAPTVSTIIPDKTKVELTVGESETVNITASSSLQLEIEDNTVISASLSGKTLKIIALKPGKSDIWVKAKNNYASISVTVKAKEIIEEPTEPPTEKPTENPVEKPIPFTDVENHWAKGSITSLYNKGIVSGMDELTFAPDEAVTRVQFITMLCKAFELQHTSDESKLNDVTKNDWYYPYVMAAYEAGITTGDDLGNFNPNSRITRQDMAVFAHRAAVHAGKTFSLTSATPFADHDSISPYAANAVYAMKNKGVINGMTPQAFEPLGTATRAQAAHIIFKLLEL